MNLPLLITSILLIVASGSAIFLIVSICIDYMDKTPSSFPEWKEEYLFMNRKTAELRIVTVEELPLSKSFYKEWELIDVWKV